MARKVKKLKLKKGEVQEGSFDKALEIASENPDILFQWLKGNLSFFTVSSVEKNCDIPPGSLASAIKRKQGTFSHAPKITGMLKHLVLDLVERVNEHEAAQELEVVEAVPESV